MSQLRNLLPQRFLRGDKGFRRGTFSLDGLQLDVDGIYLRCNFPATNFVGQNSQKYFQIFVSYSLQYCVILFLVRCEIKCVLLLQIFGAMFIVLTVHQLPPPPPSLGNFSQFKGTGKRDKNSI